MYDTIHPFSPSFSFLSKHLRVHFLSKKRDESWSFNWFPFLVMSCCWHNNGILSLFPFTLNQSTLEPDEDFGRKRLKLKWKLRSFSFFPDFPSRDRLNEEGAVFVALQQWSSSFSALLFWQIDSCPPLPPTLLFSYVMSDVFEPYIPVSCIFLAILSQVLWGEEVSSRFHSRRRESCLFLFTSFFRCL